VVDSPGDNILAEFTSVVDGVNCAVEIQRELAERNAELSETRRMRFRIGLNLGDVLEEGERIYGDGVNIAARMESLAEAGGICISGTVYDAVESKIGLEYEFLGEHEVKNIDKPIRAYRVLSYPGAAAHRVVKAKRATGRTWRNVVVIACLVLGASAAAWYFYIRSPAVESASVEKMAYPLPDKPSIAVLPFTNMSGDSEQDYLGDGFTERIITNLSMIPKIFVIARHSSFSFKGRSVKVQQVAEELGVRYVLEGSIQKSGDKIRITAQLIDAITGHHIWAESYDRELKELFALQDEITIKIMGAVGAEITSGVRARIIAKGTDNLKAYLKALEGYEYWYRQNKEANIKARKLAEEAIAIDPGYPTAYSLLGGTHMTDPYLGSTDSPQKSFAEAVRLFQKALALDESHPNANAGLAYTYSSQRQYEKALAQAKRLGDLNPGRANPVLGQILNYAGRYEEGIQSLEQAIRLDPKGPAFYFISLAAMYRALEQYEKAIGAYKKAIDGQPDNVFAHALLAATYYLAGREEEARDEAAETLRIDPSFSVEKFEKVVPLKDQENKNRLFKGMRGAGLK
jgi:adenylate cyclase